MYDKLASMLQCMEAHEQNSDVDRVNELIKVNAIPPNTFSEYSNVCDILFVCLFVCLSAG